MAAEMDQGAPELRIPNVRVAVAQLGARWHYTVPRTLERMGALERLYTDISTAKGWPRLIRAIPRGLQTRSIRRLLGRVPEGIAADRITDFPSFGFEYAWRRSAAQSQRQLVETHLWAGRKFCRLILSEGLGSANVLYALNTAALEAFVHLRASGVKKLLEQTIAPYAVEREILVREERIYPSWAKREPSSAASDELIERELAEWAEADVIICASEFVRSAVERAGGPVARCVVIPYAMNLPQQPIVRERHRGRLRVLTVGGVGLRKGSHYVVQAARAMEATAEFRLVGSMDAPSEAMATIGPNVTFVGAVPRAEIETHYRWADVFLLPSLCEGSALVTYEALCMGLPVVCTANTGSVVEDGTSGYIVETGNLEDLVQKLNRFINAQLLREMSRAATERARQYTLARYAQRLGGLLHSMEPGKS